MEERSGSEHSPLPWKITATTRHGGKGFNLWLHASDGRYINRGAINYREDAEFIVRAVNSHADLLAQKADLLAALKAGVSMLSKGACLGCGAEPGVNIDCVTCEWIAQSEALFANFKRAEHQ